VLTDDEFERRGDAFSEVDLEVSPPAARRDLAAKPS